MRILIIASVDNCTAQMAKGWLCKFDGSYDIYTAGTEKAGTLDSHAVEVMKENGIDISRYSCNKIDRFLSENWDYVISVEGDSIFSDLCFSGFVKHKLSLQLPDPEEEAGSSTLIDEVYRQTSNDIRILLFDFYLNEINGKQILGADSCGAECDIEY